MTQDILITPGSGEPQILFRGSGTTAIELNVLPSDSSQSATGSGTALSFEGTQGQLFSITDNLSSGTLFSVSDIAGLPFLEVNASGDVILAEYGRDVLASGLVTAATGVALQRNTPTTTTDKLYNVSGSLYFNGSAVGGNPFDQDLNTSDSPTFTSATIGSMTLSDAGSYDSITSSDRRLALRAQDGSVELYIENASDGNDSFRFNTDSGIFQLFSDADNQIDLRNGTSPNALKIFNTWTDASNFERGSIGWDSNVFTIGTEAAGAGTDRGINFITGGTTRGGFNTAGKLQASSKIYLHATATSNQPYITNSADYLAVSSQKGFIASHFSDRTSGDVHMFTQSSSSIEMTDTDGAQSFMSITPRVGQGGTAAYNGLKIDITESSLGDGSSGDGNNAILVKVGGTSKFKVDNAGNIIADGLDIVNSTATDVGLSVKGATSQSADLAQYQNNAGTVMASVDSGGTISSVGGLAVYDAGFTGINTSVYERLTITDDGNYFKIFPEANGTGVRNLRLADDGGYIEIDTQTLDKTLRIIATAGSSSPVLEFSRSSKITAIKDQYGYGNLVVTHTDGSPSFKTEGGSIGATSLNSTGKGLELSAGSTATAIITTDGNNNEGDMQFWSRYGATNYKRFYIDTNTGGLFPGIANTYDLGSSSKSWADAYLSGIVLVSNTPTTTTNKLYNVGGDLYFNGSAVGGSVTGVPSGIAFFGSDSGITSAGDTLYYDDDTNTLQSTGIFTINTAGFKLTTPNAAGGDVNISVSNGGNFLDIHSTSSSSSPRMRIGGATPGSSASQTLFLAEGGGVTGFKLGDRNASVQYVFGQGGSASQNDRLIFRTHGGIGWSDDSSTVGYPDTLITRSATGIINILASDGSLAGDFSPGSINAGNLTASGNITVDGQTSTDVGLTVQGAPSQSANLQEWQDSSDNVAASMDVAGNFAVSGNIDASGSINVIGEINVAENGRNGTGGSVRFGNNAYLASSTTNEIYMGVGSQEYLSLMTDRYSLRSGFKYAWSSNNNPAGAYDTALARVSAGAVSVLDSNDDYGTLYAETVNTTGHLYAGDGTHSSSYTFNVNTASVTNALVINESNGRIGINTTSLNAVVNIGGNRVMNFVGGNSNIRSDDGNLYLRAGGGSYNNAIAILGDTIRFGDFDAGAQYQMRTAVTGRRTFVLQKLASQSADIFHVRDENSDPYFVVQSDGEVDFAQKQYIYNSGDINTSNYERGEIGWVSDRFSISTKKGGTGVVRKIRLDAEDDIELFADEQINFAPGGASAAIMNTTTFFPQTDKELDLGQAAKKWDAIYAETVNATGLIRAVSGVQLDRNTPATTTDKLYNVGGSLYFNGSAVGGGGGGTLAVADGGTNATSFADKSVIISQDSGDDTLAAAQMDGNGELLIGGTSGPAVANMTSSGGTIAVTNGDGTISIDTAGGGPSDERLKKNIKSFKNPLEKLCKLEAIEFDWNEEAKKTFEKEGSDIGLIAQDVEKVVPEVIGENRDYKTIEYDKLTTLLIGAVKELKQEVLDLTDEIKKLKS